MERIRNTYCLKCGNQLPDDAAFCSKCGVRTNPPGQTSQSQSSGAGAGPVQILAPSGVESLKCPSCAIEGRTLFDISKYPKGIKVLNGDISEDAAKYQAKT
ncbi:MAG TPA: zinc ribbon domain-containing protein [Candidatus Angelobacter sp.]|nr:zinc ribbon domain-containing protein [Candidatus Angelobacter sp.]